MKCPCWGWEVLAAFKYHSWNFFSSLHWFYILHVAELLQVPNFNLPDTISHPGHSQHSLLTQTLCFPLLSCKSFSVPQMPFHPYQESSLSYLYIQFLPGCPYGRSKGLEITAESCNVKAFSETESNSLTNMAAIMRMQSWNYSSHSWADR